jgi:hypothetical protein
VAGICGLQVESLRLIAETAARTGTPALRFVRILAALTIRSGLP